MSLSKADRNTCIQMLTNEHTFLLTHITWKGKLPAIPSKYY